MTDDELVALAAKAYGDDTENFSPLTDDGDALRLAVKLRLVIHVWDAVMSASVAKTLPNGDDPGDESDAWISEDDDDLYRATRRAIVRAAAAIGSAM